MRFLLFYFCFFVFTVYGSDVHWNSRLEGSNVLGGSLRIEDGDFGFLGQGKFTDRSTSSFGYLRLGFGERVGMSYLSNDTRVVLTVKITPYNDQGLSESSYLQSMEVLYSPSNGGVIVDAEDLRLPGIHKFTVEVTGVKVYTAGNPVWSTLVPSFVYLEAGFQAERYYDFAYESQPSIRRNYVTYGSTGVESIITNPTTATTQSTHEIEFAWDYVSGAELYELEWTWVDNYSSNLTGGARPTSTISLSENDFSRNSTRVRLGATSYRIPQTFSKGYLIYRVRGVGRWLDAIDKEKFGKWSSYTSTDKLDVSHWPDVLEIGVEHEQLKNWQYQATYAEDGKKKEVVQYFDGSLRNRETVTRINSTNQTVVGETVYDNEGRGVIQILPVPQKNPAIQFYPSLNLNTSGVPYNYENFDLESGTECKAVPADPLSSSSGAGAYYSTAAHQTETNWQKNVPDAEGYAFTQVEYTPDNTGRKRNESGVGTNHKIGGGHETYYYYEQPAQEELNRLFGYKIGYTLRYKKNIVIDANGQVSTSYLDASGKVIATALSGTNTTPFSDLESGVSSEGMEHKDLLGKVLQTDVDTPKDLNTRVSTGKLGGEDDKLSVGSPLSVTEEKRYHFSYTRASGSYTEPGCSGSNGVSFPYKYDVVLSIKNDCGQEFYGTDDWETPVTSIVDGKEVITYKTKPAGVLLPKGNYMISKDLVVNETKYLEYLAEYLDATKNPCLKKESDFKDEVVMDCDQSCSGCLERLGSEQDFIAMQFSTEGLDDATLSKAEIDSYTKTFKDMFAEMQRACVEPCEPISSCSGIWDAMREDMRPGGQYGSEEVDVDGNVTDRMSIYHASNDLPKNSATGVATWKTASYKNADGTDAKIEVFLNEAEDNFTVALTDKTITTSPTASGVEQRGDGTYWTKLTNLANVTDFFDLQLEDAWLDALVVYHPEYALYEYTADVCQMEKSLTTTTGSYAPNVRMSSELFDSHVRDDIENFDAAKGVEKNLYLQGELYGLDVLGNLSSITIGSNDPIFSIDPYFQISYPKHTVVVRGNTIDHTLLKKNLMIEALTKYSVQNGETMTMIMYAIRAVKSGYDVSAYPKLTNPWQELAASYAGTSSMFTKEEVDQIWGNYKFYYFSKKSQINQLLLDLYGFSLNPGMLNAAIGDGRGGDVGTGGLSLGIIPAFQKSHYFQSIVVELLGSWGFFHQLDNIPNVFNTTNYDSKEIRVTRTDGGQNSAKDDEQEMDTRNATAKAELWKQKGLCPETFDLENLLSDLALKDRITQASMNWNDVPTLVPDLVGALTNQPHASVSEITSLMGTLQGKQVKLVSSINSSNQLALNFTSALTSTPALVAQIDKVGNFSWNTYGSSWHIYSLGETFVHATNSRQAVVLIKAGATLETAEEYVVTYTTGIDLRSCVTEYNPPNNASDQRCKRKQAFDNAMTILLQEIAKDKKVGTNFALNTYGSKFTGTILVEYFGTDAEWVGTDAVRGTYIKNDAAKVSFDFNSNLPQGNEWYVSFSIDQKTGYVLKHMTYGALASDIKMTPLKEGYRYLVNEEARVLNFDCSCEEISTSTVQVKKPFDNTPQAYAAYFYPQHANGTINTDASCRIAYNLKLKAVLNEVLAHYKSGTLNGGYSSSAAVTALIQSTNISNPTNRYNVNAYVYSDRNGQNVYVTLNPFGDGLGGCLIKFPISDTQLSSLTNGDNISNVISYPDGTLEIVIGRTTIDGTITCDMKPCVPVVVSDESCRPMFDEKLKDLFNEAINKIVEGEVESGVITGPITSASLEDFLRYTNLSSQQSSYKILWSASRDVPSNFTMCGNSVNPYGNVELQVQTSQGMFSFEMDIAYRRDYYTTCDWRIVRLISDAEDRSISGYFPGYVYEPTGNLSDEDYGRRASVVNFTGSYGNVGVKCPTVSDLPCKTDFEIAFKDALQDIFIGMESGRTSFHPRSLQPLQKYLNSSDPSIFVNWSSFSESKREFSSQSCQDNDLSTYHPKGDLDLCFWGSNQDWTRERRYWDYFYNRSFDLEDYATTYRCCMSIKMPTDAATLTRLQSSCNWVVSSVSYLEGGGLKIVINGDIVVYGTLSCPVVCPPEPPCAECKPIRTAPISCNYAYDRFIAKMNTLKAGWGGADATTMYVETMTESRFCDMKYAYVTAAYLYYLQRFNIQSVSDLDYLSIAAFSNTPIGFSNEYLFAAIDNYYDYRVSMKGNPLTSNSGDLWGHWVPNRYMKVVSLCPVITPNPVMPEIITEFPCKQMEVNQAIVNAKNQYQIYLNRVESAFRAQYVQGAINTVVETFKEGHIDREFHYTLYYYDRAGNLTQTVPPKGVDRLTLSDADNAAINTIRRDDPTRVSEDRANNLTPNHTFQTDYRYNSLNQLIYQNTPDGGESRFGYDELGRLVVSQNAKQKDNQTTEPYIVFLPQEDGPDIMETRTRLVSSPQYSYTYYDELGRVVEVGEFMDHNNVFAFNEIGNLVLRENPSIRVPMKKKDWLNATIFTPTLPIEPMTTRHQVTRTIYDELKQLNPAVQNPTTYVSVTVKTSPTLSSAVESQFGTNYAIAYKNNTRNRIVGVVYQSVYNKDVSIHDNGTFYAYDVHGNVKELMQVNNDANLVALGQNIKHFDYEYNLVSGNVNKVYYQKGAQDQYVHRYHYDADNRITHAETSKDDIRFEKDAKYFYYDHGPLARTEIGDKKVQAEDYAYTIQGWLKTVNGEQIHSVNMLGDDALLASAQTTTSTPLNKMVGKDAFGFSLNYFDGDYKSANTSMLEYSSKTGAGYNNQHGPGLYNGNIRSMYTAISNNAENKENPLQTHQTVYKYDQLNRIKSMDGYYRTGTETGLTPSEYASTYSYDANGNILSMTNHAKADDGIGKQMDVFSYNYLANTNQLTNVDDIVSSTDFTGDVDDQEVNNYAYDQIGQLIKDDAEKIDKITWTVTNKVKEVIYKGSLQGKKIRFDYDAMGHRISKHVTSVSGDVSSTYYVLDAQGNAMSTYTYATPIGNTPKKITLTERNIYGSKRVGIEQLSQVVAEDNSGQGLVDVAETVGFWSTNESTGAREWVWYERPKKLASYKQEIGDKRYELANHLGNVLNVITDRKLPVADANDNTKIAYFTGDVVSYSDYLAFGQLAPNRHGSANSENYDYGFNGMRKDDDIKNSEGTSYDFGARMYDPRLGRWLSVDPLESKYPTLSPYCFVGNSVLVYIDPDGKKIRPTNTKAEQVLNTAFDNVFQSFPEIRGHIQIQVVGKTKGTDGKEVDVLAFVYVPKIKNEDGTFQTLEYVNAKGLIQKSGLTPKEKLAALAYLKAVDNPDVYEFQVNYDPKTGDETYGIFTQNSDLAKKSMDIKSKYKDGKSTSAEIKETTASEEGESEFKYYPNEKETKISAPKQTYPIGVIGIFTGLINNKKEQIQNMVNNIMYNISEGVSVTTTTKNSKGKDEKIKHSVDDKGNFSEEKIGK